MTPSEQAKQAGLSGLAELQKLTGIPRRTLYDWHRTKDQAKFKLAIDAALYRRENKMKRYCLDREPNCTCLMCGDPEGSWVTYAEAKALQKELDELKASISKIKADAVRGFANNMRDITGEASLMGHEGIMQMSSFAAKSAEAYANQLEGRE